MAEVVLYDPRTGEEERTYEAAREKDLSILASNARQTQQEWAARPIDDRVSAMLAFIQDAEITGSTTAKIEAKERGVSASQAHDEFTASLDVWRYYANAPYYSTSPAASLWGNRNASRVQYRPLGVIGAILPWNYPSLMLAWRCAPALAAGNAVIVKPAQETPATAIEMSHLASKYGVPLLVAPGDRHTGSLLTQQNLDGYAFTGSRAAGAVVARRVAPAPVSLELGGNCPAIFKDDAPDGSAIELLQKAFYNAGQSCAGPSRIIAVGEGARHRLRSAMHSFPLAVPVISAEAVKRTQYRLDEVSARGLVEKVTSGTIVRSSSEAGGFWVRPQMVEVSPGAQTSLTLLETFAPVVTLETVDTEVEALTLAADPRYGNDLAASVWTSDLGFAERTVQFLANLVGEVWVNTALEQTGQYPHSGKGGVDLSAGAMDQYRRPTTITTHFGKEQRA